MPNDHARGVPPPEPPSRDRRLAQLTLWEKILGLITALLTLVVAALGVRTVAVSGERNDLEGAVGSLRDENVELTRQRDELTKDLGAMAAERDRWRERALNPSTPADGGGDGADPAGEGSVLRSARGVKVQRGVSLELDTDDPGWGVRSAVGAGSDLYVARNGELYQYGGVNQDKTGVFGRNAPSYEDCRSFTNWGTRESEPGHHHCVKTTEGNLADVVVEKADATGVSLAITVWRTS